ncbi:MAG: glycosyltransferase [Candidatus Kuenenia sp.]|nr:glycosyltransferase [Candidatus Kuenenia hertensis]
MLISENHRPIYNMLVSVIVTTKNEEKNAENCLQSIKAQTYPQDKIEIIVMIIILLTKQKKLSVLFAIPYALVILSGAKNLFRAKNLVFNYSTGALSVQHRETLEF